MPLLESPNILVELYNHYWPWNKKKERKLHTRFEKRSERHEMLRDLSKKVSLKKLERAQRVRDEGLERVAYDPKSVKKFGGIVE